MRAEFGRFISHNVQTIAPANAPAPAGVRQHTAWSPSGVGARAYDSPVTRRRLKLYLATAVASGVAACLLGATVQWSLIVGVAAPGVLAAIPHFVYGTVMGLCTAGAREDITAAMSGTEFEDHVARIARSCGVPVIMTSLTGDWGVDIIVGKRPNRLAIQCKRQARPVGAGAIQEVVAGAPMQDCTTTMVVTNHEFTSAARKLAELHSCELVGGAELPRLRSTIRRLTEPSAPTVASATRHATRRSRRRCRRATP
jgi:restriction system protein